ncbi:MAG: ATP-binding cassette domain-containing protein [Clostridia bacterium]|nr:ATP-binding cassette domain-containing protein [Clostridia bacterium]
MADIIISTQNLTKKYGGKTVVDDVTLEIERGKIVGLVGQNGAGKTTLIRILTGLVAPTSGKFELLPNQQRNSCDVAAIVERPSIYGSMSAMDNLIAQSTLLGLTPDVTYLSTTLNLVGLDPTLKRPVKNYSLGMKQRLAIAMTLVGKPQLLILDEPTNGLDPQGIADMRDVFVNLNKELGVTIVISSHLLSELGKFATEFYIMDKGKVLKKVSADEIKDVVGAKVRLYVDDTIKTVEALKDMGKARITGDGQVTLSTNLPITQIMLTLAQENVVVRNIAHAGDALEDYYLQIIRDAHDPFANNTTNGGSL